MKFKWFSPIGIVLALLQPVFAEYAEITIDGDFSDWVSLPSITNDPADHVVGGVDFKEMWVANDNDYLYIRYSFHDPANPLVWNVRTYIDGDNNPNTGYHPANQMSFGAEITVENNYGLQSADGFFNGGTLTNTAILRACAPSGVVTQLEFRISRDVVGVSNAYENLPLISNNTIRILLQDNRDSNYDYMPDTHGVAYTFAPMPPPPSCYKEITVDGDFSDWVGVPSVAAMPADNLRVVDWKEMWLANDAEYLYIKYTLHAAANPNTSKTDFFFDGDNNSDSGRPRSQFGSEILVQGSAAYQQAGGGWNEGSLPTAEVLQSPYNSEATEFEFRIARAVKGISGIFTNQALFSSNMIRVLAYDESTNPPKIMPHAKGAVYAFAPTPPPPSCYKKITVDGDFSDWAGVPSVALSPPHDLGGVDWKEMWIANDANYLYVKYTLHAEANPNQSGQSYFFLNTDNNKTSGYKVGGYCGSEFMVHGDGNVYQQASGTWNEGALTDAGLLRAPMATAKEFEFRVSRALTGVKSPFIGQPLFTSDLIWVVAYRDPGGVGFSMPNKTGASYAIAPTPPPSGTLIQLQ